MAAFIKRILKNAETETQTSWTYREERKQFEREVQGWKNGVSTYIMA